MRKLLLVGIMAFFVSFIHGQDEVKETVIPSEDEFPQISEDINAYLNEKLKDAKIGDIIQFDEPEKVEPTATEVPETPTPETKSVESSTSSRSVTSSGSSSSSSARKSSSRKRSKRKKISLKRKRSKIKRKRKMGNRAACPSF